MCGIKNIYLKITNRNDQSDAGFVFEESKLAPVRETEIPRLELCAAVLAVELASAAKREASIESKSCSSSSS